MWLICLYQPGRKQFLGQMHVAGELVDSIRVRLAGETEVHTGVHLPDDRPSAARARGMAKTMRGYVAVDDDGVEVLGINRPPPVPVVDIAARIERLVELCYSRGWTLGDITGAGEGGDPGELGGRGDGCGLTIAEATLTRPPADWATLKAKGRPPWESHDWQPPHPTWRPPSWPDAVVEPVVEEPVLPPAPESVSEAADEAVEPGLEHEPTIADPELTDPGADPWASYPEDGRAQAIELLRDLRRRKKGAIPHENAANYMLKRAKLHPVTAAQIAALFTDT